VRASRRTRQSLIKQRSSGDTGLGMPSAGALQSPKNGSENCNLWANCDQKLGANFAKFASWTT